MTIVKQLVRYYLYFISVFFIGRLILFSQYFDRLSAADVSYWLNFLYGFRLDTIMGLALLVAPLLLLTITPKLMAKIANKINSYYVLIALMSVIFVENATFPFFAQYDVRPI